LSIGGMVKKGDYDETENGRVIRRWSTLMEVSPVAFPADKAARIDAASVKSSQDLHQAIADLESMKEIERFLRDVGGLSKGAAVALLARARDVLGGEGDPDAQEITAKSGVVDAVAVRLRLMAM
jgi:hypothetical protein